MKPNNIFVAATLLTALLMAGCTDSGTTASTGSTGTSSGTTSSVPAVQPSGLARVDFAVAFPDQGQVQASYLDPSMNALRIEVFNSAFGSVDELRSSWVSSGYSSYYTCLYNHAFNPEPCQYQPGDLVTSQTISRSSPSTSFELEPGKYQINVAQLDASGAVLAKTSSLATFVAGDNNLNLNMLYGSWDFVQPVQLRLLNTAGISHWNLAPGEPPVDANGVFEPLLYNSQNWSRSFYGPNAATPALGLGLANEAGASLSLNRIHLSGLAGLRGWGSSSVQGAYGISNLYYGGDYFTGEGFFDGYTRSLNAPHAITLESSQGYIEMGWSSKEIMETTSLGSGVLNPAFLMQQFSGGTNQNWLNLGEISYYREDYLSGSFSPEAGLFFLTPDTAADKELSLFVGQQGQTVTTPLSVTLDSSYESPSVAGQQITYLYASEETTWVDADFPATAFPITRMTSASSIEGTLIEYVAYSTEGTQLVTLGDLPAFSSMNPGQEVQLASITPEQHQRIQERIRQRILANAQSAHVQEASVQAASGAPGCFTTHERFQDVQASYTYNGSQWVADGSIPPTTFYSPFEALLRVCLHPFQMQAAALNKPDQQPTLASEMGPIQIEHAGEMAFEALDVSGEFLVNTRQLTLSLLDAAQPSPLPICSEGSVTPTSLSSTPESKKTQLIFNACTLDSNQGALAGSTIQSGEAILFWEQDPQNPDMVKADVQLKNLIIDDGTGSVEHHARYTMNFNFFYPASPYNTHFSGDDYQMRPVSSTDMWHHFKHFDWGINELIEDSSTSFPARPSFYIAAGQWGGKAVRVQVQVDFQPEPVEVEVDYTWGSYSSLTPTNPETAAVKVTGANGTFLDINLVSGGTVYMMGAFSGQSGCETTALWNDLDGNLPAADWNCP